MDRQDNFRSFDYEQTRSDAFSSERQGEGRSYYMQEWDDRDDPGMNWGMLAAGAAMLGVGSFLLMRGFQGSNREGMSASSGRGMQGRMRNRLDEARERGRGMLQGDRSSPGIEVREQITVNRPVSEVYRFWRNLENLPRVMSYLENVTDRGDRRSHWVAKGPAGQKIEWDAEITIARENELIAWRSLEGAEVPNEGSVRFNRTSDGNGTVIDVAMSYHPPAGKAGAMVARLFGREPAQEIRHDLEKFKKEVQSGNLILGTSA